MAKRFSPSSEDFLPGENLLAIILASKIQNLDFLPGENLRAIILASKIRNLDFLPAVKIFSQEKISEFGSKEIFSQLRRFSPRRKSLSHHSSFQISKFRFSPSRKSLNLAPKRFSPSSEDFLPEENLIAIILASKIQNLDFLPAVEIFSQEKIPEFGPNEIFSQLRRFSPRRKSLLLGENLASKF